MTWEFYLWRHQNAAAWAPATMFVLPLYKTHCVTKPFLPCGGKKRGAEQSDGIQRQGYKLYSGIYELSVTRSGLIISMYCQ